MNKLKKTSLVILILSVFTGCNGQVNLDPFPQDPFYTPDLVNKVCAEYKLVDETNITFVWVQDLPLDPGGPCDHMRGWSDTGFKHVQNWARDSIKKASGQ